MHPDALRARSIFVHYLAKKIVVMPESTTPEYDKDVLVGQLLAVQLLDPSDRRLIGAVLSEYGREMIESADRLDVLQRFTLERRQRQHA
jgi:hypothetical protein